MATLVIDDSDPGLNFPASNWASAQSKLAVGGTTHHPLAGSTVGSALATLSFTGASSSNLARDGRERSTNQVPYRHGLRSARLRRPGARHGRHHCGMPGGRRILPHPPERCAVELSCECDVVQGNRPGHGRAQSLIRDQRWRPGGRVPIRLCACLRSNE